MAYTNLHYNNKYYKVYLIDQYVHSYSHFYYDYTQWSNKLILSNLSYTLNYESIQPKAKQHKYNEDFILNKKSHAFEDMNIP